jgi:membrane-bound lytic murein transglycosylase F
MGERWPRASAVRVQAGVLCLSVLCAACEPGPPPEEAATVPVSEAVEEDAYSRAAALGQTLEAVRARGTLRVATRNAPTTWYLDRHDQPAGPEYDLVVAFAEHLKVEAELVVRDTPAAVLEAIDAGEADLAAAGLTATEARSGRYLFGPAYKVIHEQLVCHREGPRPRAIAGLASVGIAIPSGTSYVETLEALARDHPEITFDAREVGTEQLLAAVAAREVDCTVADSHIVSINRRYHPPLVVALDLSEDEQLVWMMAEGAVALQAALVDWFLTEDAAALREQVEAHYYALAQIFDFVELRAFQRRLRNRYPAYRDLFESAAAKYDLPAQLLAAQAYQESHWNPKAKSPTGVRGMMMLTQPTAQAMGVENRLDPAESIEGGARYLARMRERFEDTIPEPDRTYLALAAYNVGRAHMHDAQTLARERGGDPHVWQDVKAVLPLLADREVYPSLQYGYARGTEPVRYVERIRSYEDIMARSLSASAAE